MSRQSERRKEMRKAYKRALERGWEDVTPDCRIGKSHLKLQWTDGTIVGCPSTPSDYHAVNNFEADLRRVELGRHRLKATQHSREPTSMGFMWLTTM